MSFKFSWPFATEEDFYPKAKVLLTEALNKGKMPPIIVDTIHVTDLNLGTTPPELEILEIGDLADDRFRGVFKLTYHGDAFITLQTLVEANPLNIYSHLTPSFTSPNFLAASSSFKIPLTITLSDIILSGIVILVFSKAKGATLVFRNDPLESIKISSTFDSIPAIARLIQSQIENQLRLLFREDLPAIIHKLSQRFTVNGVSQEKEASNAMPTCAVPTSPRLKPVTLAEVNPDLPSLSHTNMVKINLLGSCQQTLSLSTASIPDTVYRSTVGQRNIHDDEYYYNNASKDDDDLSSIIMMRTRRSAKSGKQKRHRKVFNLRKSQQQDEPLPPSQDEQQYQHQQQMQEQQQQLHHHHHNHQHHHYQHETKHYPEPSDEFMLPMPVRNVNSSLKIKKKF
ncbi:hypothetical protein V1514DRAFT_130921 [Lipomyces japonicus]|uniref:uncharacterized protein n=1 Tax=Lipomyces japonicus TaxID=56871 RepID=UPI0034CE0577